MAVYGDGIVYNQESGVTVIYNESGVMIPYIVKPADILFHRPVFFVSCYQYALTLSCLSYVVSWSGRLKLLDCKRVKSN